MSDDRLSPFHQGLLDFLRSDISTRGNEEKESPAFQSLLEGLSPRASEETLPLGEIIENYQHFFGAKEPIYLEKVLLEAFPIRDFVDLSLTRFYPRIYRGLPRLYHKSHPSQSHIKKNFTQLPTLKKQACSKSLFSLYDTFEVKDQKVTIFTWVIADGLGDYIAAIETIKILKTRFPLLQIQWIALIPKRASHLPHPTGSIMIPYEVDCPVEMITQEALIALRNSDLVLQMPTFYPYTNHLMDKIKSVDSSRPFPKLEMVGEYGYVESSWFHPKSGAYSMGLHFLEKGILTRRPVSANWQEIENLQLKKWFSPENHFHLAYLRTPTGGAIYLHAILKSLENDSRGIDICTPDLKWLTEYLEKQEKVGRGVLEWDLGVKEIIFYYRDQEHLVSIASEGKTVRILCPGQISQGDFRKLMVLSGDFVAVRGDQSFSEAVCSGKPFFYDGVEHARYFMKDLVALAQNRISSYPSALSCFHGMSQALLYNLPVENEEWVDEIYFQEIEDWTAIALSIGLALQEPETSVGFKKLAQIIVREHSFNPFLCQLVQRALCHRKEPSIQRIENDEVSLFTSDYQSFEEMMKSLSEVI